MSTNLEPLGEPIAPWPYFEEDEINAVVECLRSGKVNYWTGEEGRRFEEEYAASIASPHAVAVSNGTVSIELALFALGLRAGDEVIVPSRTFFGTASAVAVRGLKPVVCDVDIESGNITAETVEKVLTAKTRAVIPVHLAGWPCEMDSLLELCKSRGLYLIEDCAQAHGATYRGRQVGSMGDIGSFSFCQDKILTTGGEGGLIAVNDNEIYERAWSYKDHGKGFGRVYRDEHPPGFRWLHDRFGTNFRMTEMQSAIGRLVLKKLPKWTERRAHNASVYSQYISDLDNVRLPEPPNHVSHAYYKYYFYVRPEALKSGWDRDRIRESLCDLGVPCFSGSCSEIYLEKAFSGIRPPGRLPNAKLLGETTLMLLVHPTLKQSWIENAAELLREVLLRAKR